MPHLKCEACKARLYNPDSPAGEAGDLCPGCGSLLEPVGELSEVVGFKSIKSRDRTATGRVPGNHERLADLVGEIVARRDATLVAPAELDAERWLDDRGSFRADAVALPAPESERMNSAATSGTFEAPSGVAERDERAERRDQAARVRDIAAEAIDAAAEAHARTPASVKVSPADDGLQALLADAAALRTRAASDRARAASDRERAAVDRQHAARDRKVAREQLERAYLDDLTGAYRRGIGEMAMQHEIARARRSNGRLVLAYLDVDGLKATNDLLGHAAGDALLRDVVAVLRSKLRPYDPIVRVGGDEFVCAMSDIDVDAARLRFDQVQDALESGSVTVGLTALEPNDRLADLAARGDEEVRRIRAGRSVSPAAIRV